MKRIRRQGEFMTPLRNPSNGSFPSDLLPAIMNYWAVAFRMLSNIHDGALLRI